MSGSLLEMTTSLRERAKAALSDPGHNPDLPVLIEYLDLVEAILRQGPNHPRHSTEERQKILGGFGRIALEDYAFAQSPLGLEMFDLMNRFAEGE